MVSYTYYSNRVGWESINSETYTCQLAKSFTHFLDRRLESFALSKDKIAVTINILGYYYPYKSLIGGIIVKRIRVDTEACTGCRTCELVCSYTHTGKFSPSLSRVTVIKKDRLGLDYPIVCQQCKICAVQETCLTGAFTRNGEGVVDVEAAKCTGCRACVAACTYGAVKVANSLALACDLCGGDPICVARCPTKALSYSEGIEESEPLEAIFTALLGRWGIGG